MLEPSLDGSWREEGHSCHWGSPRAKTQRCVRRSRKVTVHQGKESVRAWMGGTVLGRLRCQPEDLVFGLEVTGSNGATGISRDVAGMWFRKMALADEWEIGWDSGGLKWTWRRLRRSSCEEGDAPARWHGTLNAQGLTSSAWRRAWGAEGMGSRDVWKKQAQISGCV